MAITSKGEKVVTTNEMITGENALIFQYSLSTSLFKEMYRDQSKDFVCIEPMDNQIVTVTLILN